MNFALPGASPGVRSGGAARARHIFWAVFLGTFALRVLLAEVVPFIGDEAYYARWGLHPAWGYYDHPPLVGWLVAPFAALGDAKILLRMPALLCVHIAALCVVAMVRDLAPERRDDSAWVAGTLLLASPPALLGVFLSPDAPLALAAILCAWAWTRGVRDGRARDFLLAGLALGLACFAKYLGALVGAALVVDAIRRRRFRGLALAIAAALPFAVENVLWNYGEGWVNVVFNLVSRNESARLSPLTLLAFVGCALYLVPPPLLVSLMRRPGHPPRDAARTLAVFVLVPLASLGVISLWRLVGLHWLLGAWALVFPLAALRLAPDVLARLEPFFAWFGGLHVVAMAVLLALPATWWGSPHAPRVLVHEHAGYVLTAYGHDVMVAIAREAEGATLAAVSGSTAATLSYESGGRPAVVFGEGGAHSRQDDLDVDFRRLDGKAIFVLGKKPLVHDEIDPYFHAVRYGEFTVRGARFWWARGEAFDYPAYRDVVLAAIRDRFHRLPAWVPGPPDVFCRRYWPNDRDCRMATPATSG